MPFSVQARSLQLEGVGGTAGRRAVLAGAGSLLAAALAGARAGAADVGQTSASAAGIPAQTPLSPLTGRYRACGVGGGGAFVGLAMSPHEDLWFVGTDMGTLFRSTNLGATWEAVPHTHAMFLQRLDGQDYPDLPGPGFGSTRGVVFHAPATGTPIRSVDSGVTWAPMRLGSDRNRVRLWVPDTTRQGRALAGLDDGIAFTHDDGVTWSYRGQGLGRVRGAFFDASDGKLYLGISSGIVVSADDGKSFVRLLAADNLHRFAGGRGTSSLRFAYMRVPRLGGEVFVGTPEGLAPARRLDGEPLTGAEHVAMAENSATVYVAGARNLPGQQGTSVWRSAEGADFELIFRQADKGYGSNPWPTLVPSAIGLDVGYWDSGYFTFAVNQRNAKQLGGGELYFLHTSIDGGNRWTSPFSKAAGAPRPGRTWRSTGLENCSIRWVKFSPWQPRFGVACGCDHSVLVTEDGGCTWRVATDEGTWGRRRAPHQSCYDVLFDRANPHAIVAAFSDLHDFQHSGNYGRVQPSGGARGGIYRSDDRGHSWQRLGPDTPEATMPFVSLAADPGTGTIYAGAQGAGVAITDFAGRDWRWLNRGIHDPRPIVAELQVDPVSGDAYALVGSDPSDPIENWSWSGVYRLCRNADAWQHLRGTSVAPYAGIDPRRLMAYPTSFALMRDGNDAVSRLLLTDAEQCGNYLATGLWSSDDGGETWNRLIQYTFARTVTLDPLDAGRIYICGEYSPGWGHGGAVFSKDGGLTFGTNEEFPIQYGLWSAVPDPSDPAMLFYCCFGGGMYHGPRPV